MGDKLKLLIHPFYSVHFEQRIKATISFIFLMEAA